MESAEMSAKFPDLKPNARRPRLRHLLGFGFYLYGDRDFDMETQSFVRTLYFCLLYIPVVALRSYRVTPTDDGWSYLGTVPLSGTVRLYSLVWAVVLLGGGGLAGVDAYWNAPDRLAARKLIEAERLMARGENREAVQLLADVAVGPTQDSAKAAAKQVAKLLASGNALKNQEGLAEIFSAAVRIQRANRWHGTAGGLQRRGVELAKEIAAHDPTGALAILDLVAPLAPTDQSIADTRQDLLEKIVAANPSDPDWVTRLALCYESKGELDRCQKLLEPLRFRLGDSEGARLLGLADAHSDHTDQALRLLRAYTQGRLRRLGKAEEKLGSLYQSAQQRILKRLEKERVSDFDYHRYDRASTDGREKILIEYIGGKFKQDPEISAAQQAFIAESGVTPVALELGLILLQHAQKQTDEKARKSLLDEAESTFLAVNRVAGDRADYQLSLAQVYYWQGKHVEGRRIVNEALTAGKRDPKLLLQAASVLRAVGSHSEARVLAEEGFNTSPPGATRNGCAVIRALLGDDLDERITWLKRGDTSDPETSAILNQDLAAQAIQNGNESEAITRLKSLVAAYDAMPESPAVLNNEWIALKQLARLTGDGAARRRATTMIEKAAALEPGDSLVLSNAAGSLLEDGLREVIGGAIDLGALKEEADLNLIQFLAMHESSLQALAARVRADRSVNRARSMMEKVLLLSSRNPDTYHACKQLLAFVRDAEGLRKLFASLSRTELDLARETKRAAELQESKLDGLMKTTAQSALKYAEAKLPVGRAKGGATLAVAASELVKARMGAAAFGIPVDSSATVAVAEEGFAAASSLPGRWQLIESLLFRATERLTRADQRFAVLRDRTRRSISCKDLVAGVLSREGPLKKLALEDADVRRAVDLTRESFTASASYTTTAATYMMLRAGHPDVAEAVAKSYSGSEVAMLADEIDSRLEPHSPSVIFKNYLRARMQNKEAVAEQILSDAKAKGIPLPIDRP